ncbi:hypothetical protein O0I10_007109 [Lichtheimia ornata]|uniref:Uncharacterized protein n=1 Tax=Lichtheimia ornata TaxID=688661 RepID=A0AAD7XY59_9FUNG|nr:uncharacterized protein O0I10_007109 [Lichtheimia ornata]KAJ8657293.1 hypothetical protein O0I10_007109 [Lichtheimia ornata]
MMMHRLCYNVGFHIERKHRHQTFSVSHAASHPARVITILGKQGNHPHCHLKKDHGHLYHCLLIINQSIRMYTRFLCMFFKFRIELF